MFWAPPARVWNTLDCALRATNVLWVLLGWGPFEQMAEMTATTLGRRAARAEIALSRAEERWRRRSKEAGEENASLVGIIDRLEGVLLAQQVLTFRRNWGQACSRFDGIGVERTEESPLSNSISELSRACISCHS